MEHFNSLSLPASQNEPIIPYNLWQAGKYRVPLACISQQPPTMRHYIALFIIFSLLFAGCGQKKGSPKASEAVSKEIPPVDTVFRDTAGIVQDTCWGKWRVMTRRLPNKIKMMYDYGNNFSIFITITHAGKVVMNSREFTTHDFGGAKNDDEFQLWIPEVALLTPDAVFVEDGCWIPETDEGWYNIMGINARGEIKQASYVSGLGATYCDLANEFMFYLLYEVWQKPTPDNAAVRKVLEKYCTPTLTAKLSSDKDIIGYLSRLDNKKAVWSTLFSDTIPGITSVGMQSEYRVMYEPRRNGKAREILELTIKNLGDDAKHIYDIKITGMKIPQP